MQFKNLEVAVHYIPFLFITSQSSEFHIGIYCWNL